MSTLTTAVNSENKKITKNCNNDSTSLNIMHKTRKYNSLNGKCLKGTRYAICCVSGRHVKVTQRVEKASKGK
jgi:hypothetical protein